MFRLGISEISQLQEYPCHDLLSPGNDELCPQVPSFNAKTSGKGTRKVFLSLLLPRPLGPVLLVPEVRMSTLELSRTYKNLALKFLYNFHNVWQLLSTGKPARC